MATRHRRLIAFVLAVLVFAPTALAQSTRPVEAVLGVSINVDDMDRSLVFFTKVLDFKPISDVTDAVNHIRLVKLKLLDETIELTDYLQAGGKPIPADSRSNDRWFQHIAIVTTDMDTAYAQLQAHHVLPASVAPQRLPDWNKNAGGIRAFYFFDPDNHVLELIQFPPGKGDPKWQSHSELFAGIDHTAIVVANTKRSLTFYRDQLGMKVVGGSENYGIEQERLNNVPGAHLRITTLRAADGPGVELLEYLHPRDGRDYPRDIMPNDLLRWQTIISRVGAAAALRDPDGHFVTIRAPATSNN